MLVISEAQVRGLLDLDELIATLEQAHIQFSAGRVVMPVRSARTAASTICSDAFTAPLGRTLCQSVCPCEPIKSI